jgi:GR25 family glycosyltransferase involved in LPS biosynthesis
MNIYDNIKKIIYINLDSRRDRRVYIEKFLSKYFVDIPIIRFGGMMPEKCKEYDFINKKIKKSKNANIHTGIIGCYTSHLCILKQLYDEYYYKDKNEFVLIIEDDTCFDLNFINKLKEPLNISNWNILLGINPSCRVNYQGINNYSNYKKKHIFGTNIVIYNLNNIKQLYKDILSIPVIIDYDFMLKENISGIFFFDTKYIWEKGDVKLSDIRPIKLLYNRNRRRYVNN